MRRSTSEDPGHATLNGVSCRMWKLRTESWWLFAPRCTHRSHLLHPGLHLANILLCGPMPTSSCPTGLVDCSCIFSIMGLARGRESSERRQVERLMQRVEALTHGRERDAEHIQSLKVPNRAQLCLSPFAICVHASSHLSSSMFRGLSRDHHTL